MDQETLRDFRADLIAEAERMAKGGLLTLLDHEVTLLAESNDLPKILSMILLDYPKGDIRHAVEEAIWNDYQIEKEYNCWLDRRKSEAFDRIERENRK